MLHRLPGIRTVFGDAYADLYLAEPSESARVALTRIGTRVIEDISSPPGLQHAPWILRYVQGLVDVPFVNLTPGTRNGIVQDERYAALIEALQPLEVHVKGLIEEQQRAEEEQASQQSLKAIQKAFHEAMLALPREEYDWFDVQGRARPEGAFNSLKKLSWGLCCPSSARSRHTWVLAISTRNGQYRNITTALQADNRQ
ncbi:MAG: hypothetical protein ABSE43_09280 [Steroidobacteraceae bacterium]